MGTIAAIFLIFGLNSHVDSSVVGARPQTPKAEAPEGEACYRKVVAGTRRRCTQVKNREPSADKSKPNTHTECKDVPYYREEVVPCKNG